MGDDIKKFLLYARGDDKNKIAPIGKEVIIKIKNKKTKFKLRCPRYLYTLKIDDEAKAQKIRGSFPNSKYNLFYLFPFRP
ncbi:MAG: 60S ribosomal protein L38 [archaeon]|nr:60S ribosomal protein L38 [archaeon]